MIDLYHGDCLEVMAQLPDASVDMILCDLPYGTTRNKWDSVIPLPALWEQYRRIAKPSAAIVLTAQCPFDKALGASNLEMLRYEWIWRKEAGSGFLNAKRAPLKDHENVLVFYREPPTYSPQMRTGFKPYTVERKALQSDNYGAQTGCITVNNGDRYPLTVVDFKRDPSRLHPTQKPEDLTRSLILTCSRPNDFVVVPFAGSGTECAMSVKEGRKSIGFETRF